MKQVFIGGCGRSGTTFLGALIGRKTNSIVTPESQFKFDLLNRPDESGPSYLRELESNWRFGNWGLDSNTLERKMESVSSLSEFLTVTVKEYGALIGRGDSDVWVDHTPNNIDYMISLVKIFPDAKFIHLIRDGRGVAASVIPLPWGTNTIVGAADWWMQRLAVGLAAEHFFNPDRVLRIRYEDLIMNAPEMLNSIVEFLGLQKSVNVTDSGNRMILPSFTKEQHKLVNEPPDESRITGWKDTLTARQIEIFELKAQMLMQYLGYERYSKGSIKPINTYESMKMRLNSLFRKYYKNRKIFDQWKTSSHD